MAGAPTIPKWITTVFAFLAMKPMLANSAPSSSEPPPFNWQDPDLYYITMELICEEGYPVQEHTMVTEDGYILNMHRIPNGNRKERVKERGKGYTTYHEHVHPAFHQCVNDSLTEKGGGPPVIIQHGFIAASDSWVLQGAGKDLAYLLADAGYDVWLGNGRGNFYSPSHKYLSPKSKKFWDFSIDEIGIFDLPAMIDYVLKETGHKQVYYIGHSMGTTQVLIMGSTRPEYMKKIRLATLLAPVGNLSDTLTSAGKTIVPQLILGTAVKLENRKRYVIAQRQIPTAWMLNSVCTLSPMFLNLCYAIGTRLEGQRVQNIDQRTFVKAFTHLLSGSSTKIVSHALQLLSTKELKGYDYGPEINYKVYNQATPRKYNVSQVTCPVAIFYSDLDFFVDVDNVRNLEKQLPNVVFTKMVPKLLHTDFMFARQAKEEIYDDIMKVMAKF